MNALPKVYTRKEAARAAKVSVWTIDKALGTGELPAKVYGTRTLILEECLATFIKNMPDYKTAPNPRSRKRRGKP